MRIESNNSSQFMSPNADPVQRKELDYSIYLVPPKVSSGIRIIG